jgi:hypothetical protein
MTDEIRFDMEIRWAREKGWLQVRDPFTGGWHEILAKEAPRGWTRAATRAKMSMQGGTPATRPATSGRYRRS